MSSSRNGKGGGRGEGRLLKKLGVGRRKDLQSLTDCELPGAEGGVFSFLPALSTEMSAR